MFNEILQIAEKRFSVGMNRATAHADFAVVEAAIAIEEAEIGFLESNMTEEDMTLRIEQASQGVVGKVRDAIKAIIEKVKEFFKAIKNKIVSIFSSEKSKQDIEALEKKVKLNPFARNKKVVVPETEKKVSLIKKTQAKYAQLIAKIKSGKKVEVEEVHTIKDFFEKEYAKIAGATATVGAVAAFALIKKRMNSVGKEVDDVELAGLALLEEANKQLAAMEDTEGVSDMARLVQEVSTAVADTTKRGGTMLTSDVANLIAEIKKAIAFSKETPSEIDADRSGRRADKLKEIRDIERELPGVANSTDHLPDIDDTDDYHATSGEDGFVGEIQAILEGGYEEPESVFDLL